MSNGRDEISQMQRLISRLSEFLNDSELQQFGLDADIKQLTGLERQMLQDLNAAQAGLVSVDERDKRRNDPLLRGEREQYNSDIGIVQADLVIKLIPEMKKLQACLKQKAGGEKVAESLGQILNQFREFAQGGGGEPPPPVDPMSREDSQKLAPQVSVDLDKASQLPLGERLLRPPGELRTPSESPMVPVSRAHVTKLHEHQIRLDNYVKGYIASRELFVLCTKIVHRLEYGRLRASLDEIAKEEYWQEIKNWLDAASGDDVVPAALMDEFNTSVQQVKTALNNTTGTVDKSFELVEAQDFTSLSKAVAQACRQMQTALNSVDLIARRCQDNAKMELSRVSEEVEQILETFREAGKFQLQPDGPSERLLAPKLAAAQTPTERGRKEAWDRGEEKASDDTTTRTTAKEG